MPTILYFSDSNSSFRGGRGATIRLDSGEPCLLSIAQTSVRVKKSRMGWFGPTLYEERVVYKSAQTAQALMDLFPNNLLPSGFNDPVLRAFANAILHCSSCAEVAVTLNNAVANAEAQAKPAAAVTQTEHTNKPKTSLLSTAEVQRIINDYGALIERDPPTPLRIEDASKLPYSKETILNALLRALMTTEDKKLFDALAGCAISLAQYQEGVGKNPLELLAGIDFSKGARKSSLEELRAEAKRFAKNPTADRYKEFSVLVERDIERISKLVNTAGAVRLAKDK